MAARTPARRPPARTGAGGGPTGRVGGRRAAGGELAVALRVIAEAGIRLRADGKGLALEIRTVISRALREAQAASRDSDIPSPTTRMADDADRDSNRMRTS